MFDHARCCTIRFFIFRWPICRHRGYRIRIAEAPAHARIAFPRSVALIFFVDATVRGDEVFVFPPFPVGIDKFDYVSARL